MTDTGPLRDYARSRAVLIGAWDYTHLAPVPAARNSLERMAGLLTGPLCGWPKQRVEVLRNFRQRDRLPDQLVQLLDGVKDVALFYFVGHGQLYEDELCLALGESPKAGARCKTVGLPFSDVRDALRACDAQTKIVILDCCFAGHAFRRHALAPTPTNVSDKALGTGAFTMAASGAYNTAWFEGAPDVADPQTYFTKYLIDVIEQGITDHPQGLPLGPIYDQTAQALALDRLPQPTRSVRHDADHFILARNIAEPPVTPDSGDSDNGTDEPSKFLEFLGPHRRSIILGSLTTLTAGTGTFMGLRLADGFGGHQPSGSQSQHPSASRRQSGGAPGSHLRSTLTGHTDAVKSVAFSPDGKTLASAGWDETVRLWNVAARSSTATLNDHTNRAESVAFSPDGKTLASASWDKTVQLWNVAARGSTAPLNATIGMWSVAFSPDGKTLASAGWDETVRLWNVAARRSTTSLNGHTDNLNSVAFSPDGKTLASAGDDKTVRLWNVAGRSRIAILSGHTEAVSSVAFSPDGKTLASAGDDKTVRLWNVARRSNFATLNGHTEFVSSVAFSPDGKTLASASDDKTIRLWKLA